MFRGYGFCHTDQTRTDTYGLANQIPSKINGLLTSTAGNPQEVADAVLLILETPPGQRRLRYRVSPASLGVDEINALSESVQTQLLESFGVATETAFVHRSAAGSS